MDNKDGVWRTIRGRRVFIANGEDLETAMKKSGKFDTNNSPLKKYRDEIDKTEFKDLDKLDYKKMYDDYEKWYNTLDKNEIKDLLDKWQEHYKDDLKEIKTDNPIGKFINKELGYDGLPELIEEGYFFDKINFRGKKIIDYDTTLLDEKHWYRGIDAGEKTQEYIKQFKEGNFFAGEGYGVNGTYFSKSHSEAMTYAKNNEKNLIYSMPKDNAKIITREKANYIMNEIRHIIDYNKYMNEESEDYMNFTDIVLNDSGYTASLLGYDIIEFTEDSRIAVLNRSSIKVVK